MKIKSIPRTWRHLRRYRQIVGVLLKYGFNEIVDIAQKDLIVRFGRKFIPRLKAPVETRMTRAERLRHAAEELGPTFVKMGQILSLRPELIPPDIALEFQQLQDKVAPFPFDKVIAVIEEELIKPVNEVFLEIHSEPLAAASIAQVHRATLLDGKQIVIKVQRPDIKSIIEVDLEILKDLAAILSRYSEDIAIHDPQAIILEFDRSINRELDFHQEGRNIQRFNRLFADDPIVYIPSYYEEHSTRRILVMDYVKGIKASNLDEINDAGLDTTIIAKRGVQLLLKQIFEFGFFHADPHPGNIMVMDDNIIAPLDYGMVGYLNESSIEELGNVLSGIIKKDIQRTLRAFQQLGIVHEPGNRLELEAALNDFINRYYEVPLKQLQVSTLLAEIYQIVHEHQLSIPPNLSLMMKALVTVEGLGRKLYPDFDMVSEVRPYLKRLALNRFDPRRRFSQSLLIMEDFFRLAEDFPQSTRDIMQKIKQGELRVQFEHRNLEKLASAMNRSSNRTAAAMIIAALIVGSSLILQVNYGPSIYGFPLIGLAGYLLASVLGLKLIWDIFRSTR